MQNIYYVSAIKGQHVHTAWTQTESEALHIARQLQDADMWDSILVFLVIAHFVGMPAQAEGPFHA